jgi:competence protein ComEC
MMAFIETKKKSVLFAFIGSFFLFFAMHQWVKYDNQQKEAFVVFQRYKSSLFLKTCEGKIEVFTNSKTKDSIFLKNYIRESFPVQSVTYSKIQEFYHFKKQKIQVVARSYRLKEVVPNSEILVLKNSPKVNLERLLQKTKSRLVVADGSNYPTFKKRWRKTCRALDVSFHDTAKEGAFVLQKK